METISVHELARKHENEESVDLIDLRMPREFREVHAECARSFPLDSLDPNAIAASRNGRSGEPLYLICQSGNRSGQAHKKFVDAGIENVVNVEGGTTAWVAAGLPVVRGKKAFPLMQQVQITAGFLVVLGVVLGYFVHPNFVGLSAFIGAGLVFAGCTGICPMAASIAKMPWNQCGDGTSCSA